MPAKPCCRCLRLSGPAVHLALRFFGASNDLTREGASISAEVLEGPPILNVAASSKLISLASRRTRPASRFTLLGMLVVPGKTQDAVDILRAGNAAQTQHQALSRAPRCRRSDFERAPVFLHLNPGELSLPGEAPPVFAVSCRAQNSAVTVADGSVRPFRPSNASTQTAPTATTTPALSALASMPCAATAR